MHIKDIDLNLLRLFDAVYRCNSVSRAAEQLELTQPAASQGLTRLRALLHDPLFVRASGGVAPTPMAQRLADAVRNALATLEQALNELAEFDPLASQRTFRIHMSDIGEARFLPELMSALRTLAPGVHIQTSPVPADDIADALDRGRIDFAFGFLPTVKDTQRQHLLTDRYIVLLREKHPFALEFNRRKRPPAALLESLHQLEFVAVRSHSDTLRILQMLKLESRLRLTTEHFMVLPAIVRATDLAVVMPYNIAMGFAEQGGYAIIQPPFPLRDFSVALHSSRRFESDPGNRWLRQTLVRIFAQG
ncbi:LysR family transcriptional regulator [Variovorax sp. RT4R15]|uniref:LysR family transcriptional regulator n=1 Tax=Variovorax sp. RT4R15 TaxID=3443737 RepID=UPI003F46BD1F